MQNKYQSPWFVEALQSEGKLEISKLETNMTTDICIVGGGYTGLWTALKIKEKDFDKKPTKMIEENEDEK